jgi:DNA polymerase
MENYLIKHKLDELYSKYVSNFINEEIVLGEGCIDSPLVIIGEAPGKDEVRLKKPFVGSAGKNLNEFIDILGIERESLFITNVIKYRLGKQGKSGNIINRPATREDITKNQNWLLEEIGIIQPKIIITLGNVPLRAVLDNFRETIGSMHGLMHNCTINGHIYQLYPLYHPASIIYNRALKQVYIEDVLRLSNYLCKNSILNRHKTEHT